MKRRRWDHGDHPSQQAAALAAEAAEMGFLCISFGCGGDGSGLEWPVIEPWTRSRAVTVAVVEGAVRSPALEIAMCCDLVFLLPSARFQLAVGHDPPAPGVIWALGRAGRRALSRGLLNTADIEPSEAVELGIAHDIISDRERLPLSDRASLTAVTTARDLMRSEVPGNAGLALELAAFRLLVASGDPARGARAFLAKRPPDF